MDRLMHVDAKNPWELMDWRMMLTMLMLVDDVLVLRMFTLVNE